MVQRVSVECVFRTMDTVELNLDHMAAIVPKTRIAKENLFIEDSAYISDFVNDF
jgi:hypothetical protein